MENTAEKDFEFLAEIEEIWAKMLMNVLEENNIPCASFPVNGAGLVMKAGVKESLRLFVPAEKITNAREILEELLPDLEK